MSNNNYIEAVNLTSKSAIIYPHYPIESQFKRRVNPFKANLIDNRVRGCLSLSSKKRIRRIVDNWFDVLKVRNYVWSGVPVIPRYSVSFCTLTLPARQSHDDKTIKRECLNYFLVYLKRKCINIKYLWVAEKQKNGNIHFHILFNQFIDYQLIRSLWNASVERLGYVSEYQVNQKKFFKNGFQVRSELIQSWSIDKQLIAYNAGMQCDWTNPNSTDIQKLDNINNVSAYITKYLTKSDNTQLIEGKLWHCSDTLTNLKPIGIYLNDYSQEFFKMEYQTSKIQSFKGENFQVLKGFDLLRNPNQFKELTTCLINNRLEQYQFLN